MDLDKPYLKSQSVKAILIGLFVAGLLTLGTYLIFRLLGILSQNSYLAIAVVYRSLYTVLGGYIAARLAPSSFILHATILGVIQVFLIMVLSLLFIPMQYFSPTWYYITLSITAVPCAFFGGVIRTKLKKSQLQINEPGRNQNVDK